MKTVRGPDLEHNIVELGMVSDVFISDGKVYFSITVPAERARELEPLRLAAERVIKEMPGVKGALVALTADKKAAANAPAARPARARGAVGIPRQREQDAHVSERERDDAPAFDHACCFSARDRTQGAAPAPCFLRNASIVRKAWVAVQQTGFKALNKRDFPPSRCDLGLPAWGASHRLPTH